MRAAEAAGDPLGNCSLPWGGPSRPQTAQGPGTDPLPDASCSVSPQETPAGPAPVPPPQRSYPWVPAAAAVVLPGTCPDGNPKSWGGERVMQKVTGSNIKPLGASGTVLPSLLSLGRSLLLGWIMQDYVGAFRGIPHGNIRVR